MSGRYRRLNPIVASAPYGNPTIPPLYYATLDTIYTFDHPQQNSIHPLHSLLCHVRFMDTVLYTVLWIKTALLHDNVLYKNVRKQSVAYWHPK